MINSLIALYQRDLNKLKEELSLYSDEKLMWKTIPGTANSAGNLAMHLIGNLNHFICSVFGKTGYVRDREFEFAGKDVPRAKLYQQIDQTVIDVVMSLKKITAEEMAADYPIDMGRKDLTTELFMVHLTGHLSYHLGQINYHRRMLDGASK